MRRSLTRGAITSTAPALVSTSRGWWRAVAHHQPAPVLVALVGELGDVGVDLGLQRLGQHPPGALADDLVDQRRRPSRRRGSSASAAPGTTVSTGRTFPTGVGAPILLEGLKMIGRVRPLLAHPQVSSIAPSVLLLSYAGFAVALPTSRCWPSASPPRAWRCAPPLTGGPTGSGCSRPCRVAGSSARAPSQMRCGWRDPAGRPPVDVTRRHHWLCCRVLTRSAAPRHVVPTHPTSGHAALPGPWKEGGQGNHQGSLRGRPSGRPQYRHRCHNSRGGRDEQSRGPGARTLAERTA